MASPNRVTPATGLSTDISMIINSVFPNGKPEMAAKDFKAAYETSKASLGGKPRPTHFDYPHWAHCMLVEHKLECDRAKSAGKPPPLHMNCPQCGTAMVLDHSQSDVLTCMGGCNRAITVQAFGALFRSSPPPKKTSSGYNKAQGAPPGLAAALSGALNQKPAAPGPPSITRSYSDPVAAGIVEKMPKSRKPLTSWRVWTVPDANPVRLKSISYDVRWPPMEPIRGGCVGKSEDEVTHAGSCPSWAARCGVYSVKTLADIDKWSSYAVPGSSRVGVVGEIEMWGRVLEYEDGFRSEFAYPLRLWLPESLERLEWDYLNFEGPEDLAEKLWSTYLVEVNISDKVFYERILDG